MTFSDNLRRTWSRALGIGVINGLLLSAVMVPAFLLGVSPFPQPPSLAFADTITGRDLPMPVGLLFHLAYVTFWSVVFVAWAYPRLTLTRALSLAFILWIGILVVFFPINGWGLLGLAVSPRLVVASFIPHLLFGVFLWGLARLMLRGPKRRDFSS